jgi:RTX calcium-binding nonapeptide repeat (4 copies)
MHLPTPAGPRRRTRRALLAAALPAALAAVALPSAADAATVEVVGTAADGIVAYEGEPGEANNVRVSLTAEGIVIDDAVPIRSLDSQCRTPSTARAICPATVNQILVFGRDGNDFLQYKAPHAGHVNGGSGADKIFGGMRQAGFGRAIEPVSYRGNDFASETATDTFSYVFADRAVKVDLADATSGDGRPGIDRDEIEDSIELVEGSNFDDTLFGSDRTDTFRGLNGNDVISGAGGNDFVDEGPAPNGADTIIGGAGTGDRVSYGTRTAAGVNVSLDGVGDDGAAGENDDVRTSVEHIWGTNFGDTLTGNGSANTIEGFGGLDTISGLAGNDTLAAGAGNNAVLGGTGNDVIEARNGAIDNINCGEHNNDSDTANRDTNENSVVDCERGTVGVLRLTPASVRAKAGETARLKLSWRHPKAWKQLKKIELRLTQDGITIGELTIRPNRDRIADDGAIRVKRSRILTRGKTVTAHLALRLDQSLAGQTLKAEVEATEAGGRRQLERDAGTVRIAR